MNKVWQTGGDHGTPPPTCILAARIVAVASSGATALFAFALAASGEPEMAGTRDRRRPRVKRPQENKLARACRVAGLWLLILAGLVRLQFSIAHPIRAVKFLVTLWDVRTRDYGTRLRDATCQLFAVIHRGDELKPATFVSRLAAACELVMGKATKYVAPSREAQSMAARFRERGHAYFEFITTPNVEPTNNLAEQAIRFVVIDRRITQATRGESGRRWCERIRTARATCSRAGRDVRDFLDPSFLAHFRGEPPPSLLEPACP
jgi:transposase